MTQKKDYKLKIKRNNIIKVNKMYKIKMKYKKMKMQKKNKFIIMLDTLLLNTKIKKMP